MLEEAAANVGKVFDYNILNPFGTWFHQWTRSKTVRNARRFIRQWILLVSVVLQLIVIAALSIAPSTRRVLVNQESGTGEAAGLWFGIAVQAMQIGLLLSTALKFVHRAWQLNVSFVIQSYVALVMAFAGIYVLLFLIDRTSMQIPRSAWTDQLDVPLQELKHPQTLVISLYLECLYFSLVLQSTVGFGDVYPMLWWSRLVVAAHMVVTVVVNVVLLGFGLAHIGELVAARIRVAKMQRSRSLSTSRRTRTPALAKDDSLHNGRSAYSELEMALLYTGPRVRNRPQRPSFNNKLS